METNYDTSGLRWIHRGLNIWLFFLVLRKRKIEYCLRKIKQEISHFQSAYKCDSGQMTRGCELRLLADRVMIVYIPTVCVSAVKGNESEEQHENTHGTDRLSS